MQGSTAFLLLPLIKLMENGYKTYTNYNNKIEVGHSKMLKHDGWAQVYIPSKLVKYCWHLQVNTEINKATETLFKRKNTVLCHLSSPVQRCCSSGLRHLFHLQLLGPECHVYADRDRSCSKQTFKARLKLWSLDSTYLLFFKSFRKISHSCPKQFTKTKRSERWFMSAT